MSSTCPHNMVNFGLLVIIMIWWQSQLWQVFNEFDVSPITVVLGWFSCICQVAPMCTPVYICATWWIQLNLVCEAAMQHCVRLLWPLVVKLPPALCIGWWLMTGMPEHIWNINRYVECHCFEDVLQRIWLSTCHYVSGLLVFCVLCLNLNFFNVHPETCYKDGSINEQNNTHLVSFFSIRTYVS